MRSVLLVLASSCLASCLPPPHPAVVAFSLEDEQLPFHLRKPALFNPHLQKLLPLTSVLHRGEEPVFEREADKVHRQEIYNILTHAGLIRRLPPHLQPDPAHQHHHRHGNPSSPFQQQRGQPVFNDDHPLFNNPDLLQYL